MKISLLVIRCQDIEVSKNFYQLLGLSFIREKHGDGPVHYSCEHDGTVFELYPNKGNLPQDNIRLGFKVSDLAHIIEKIPVTNTYKYAGNTVYILTDPDHRKVEINE